MNKVSFITGASRGLGAGIARAALDVTKRGAPDEAVKAALARFGRIAGMGGVYCENVDIAVPVPADFAEKRGVRPWAMNPEFAERLWTMSEARTGLRFDT